MREFFWQMCLYFMFFSLCLTGAETVSASEVKLIASPAMVRMDLTSHQEARAYLTLENQASQPLWVETSFEPQSECSQAVQVEVYPARFILEPWETREITIHLKAENLHGEFYGLVRLYGSLRTDQTDGEQKKAGATESEAAAPGAAKLGATGSVIAAPAIWVYALGTHPYPCLRVVDTKVTPGSTETTVSFRAENRGNVHLQFSVGLEALNGQEEPVAFSGYLLLGKTLLPAQTLSLSVRWQPPPKTQMLRVVLKSSGHTFFGDAVATGSYGEDNLGERVTDN